MPKHMNSPAKCEGPSCMGCSSMNCMSKGGEAEMEKEAMPPMAEEGPEPEMGDEGGDELHKILGDELMDAFERKDRKGFMDGLEALVMSCISKGEQG